MKSPPQSPPAQTPLGITPRRATGSGDPQVVLDGKYRLEEPLGEGATGVVYRALHLGLKKAFAVKLLKTGSPGPLSLARFQREAEALGQLRHPHVVEVTDFGIDASAGISYLVLELLDGVTLADLCREQGALPLERALPILDGVAEAIDAAHARGILHRDLKPGNVLLCRAAEGEPLVKVLDFGLAEISGREALGHASETTSEPIPDERLTTTGALLGTPLYAAPEILRQGPASRASDLYSFGVIAYEALAGKPPFRGPMAEVLAGHLHREPPRPAGLSDEVWEVLRELLHKDPALRPPSAVEAMRRLRRAAERVELARWRRTEIPRRLRLAALLTLAALLAGILLPASGLPPAERWLHDLRFRTAPPRSPDPRILLVTLDEASPGNGTVSLVDRADEIGRTLDRVFAAGAVGVAIDYLLPAKWSHSHAFSDLVLRHPDGLTLAAFSEPDGSVLGTDCVAGFTAVGLGPERTAGLFGFANLDDDPDGVTRRGRLRFRDRSGTERPSWAARAAGILRPPLPSESSANRFWIDHRIDWRRYDRISWRDIPAALDRRPERFRGRLVLVGGEVLGSGDDYHRIPHRSGGSAVVSGLTLQALLADTIAAGLPVREIGRWPVLLTAALLIVLALTGILCARRAAPLAAGLAAAAILYVGLSFVVFGWMSLMLPVSSPLLLVLLGLSLALAVRRTLPPPPEVSP